MKSGDSLIQLYDKPDRGDLQNFTGIDSPYEPPENPEIRIDTTAMSPDQGAAAIIEHLERAAILPPHWRRP